MHRLADYTLEVGAESFAVSVPITGDRTRSSRHASAAPRGLFSLGVTPPAAAHLLQLVGREARLVGREGEPVASLVLRKVDRDLNLLVTELRSSRSKPHPAPGVAAAG